MRKKITAVFSKLLAFIIILSVFTSLAGCNKGSTLETVSEVGYRLDHIDSFYKYSSSGKACEYLSSWEKAHLLGTPENTAFSINNNRTNLFDFKKRLEELVASDEHTKDYKQVIADWMVVRKKKGAANTLTAFNRVANQMEIARKANHCTYEDCVRMSAENSWIGFEAAWMERKYGEASISFRNAQSPDWKQVTAQNNYRDID